MTLTTAEEDFTYKFTAETVVIAQTMSILKLSIKCLSSSTANGTITGRGVAGQYSSNAIDIEPGDSVTFTKNNQPLGQLTIVAPSGCTICLIGERSA